MFAQHLQVMAAGACDLADDNVFADGDTPGGARIIAPELYRRRALLATRRGARGPR